MLVQMESARPMTDSSSCVEIAQGLRLSSRKLSFLFFFFFVFFLLLKSTFFKICPVSTAICVFRHPCIVNVWTIENI